MARSSKSAFTTITDFFYDRIRHRDAWSAGDAETTADFGLFAGHQYALLITYRRNGEGVPSPVWFGLDGRDRLYFGAEAAAPKVSRIRSNPQVLLAPCDFRGKPLGPTVFGTARILDPIETKHAEQLIAANYGTGRKLYQRVLPTTSVYIEVRTGRSAAACNHADGVSGPTR